MTAYSIPTGYNLTKTSTDNKTGDFLGHREEPESSFEGFFGLLLKMALVDGGLFLCRKELDVMLIYSTSMADKIVTY